MNDFRFKCATALTALIVLAVALPAGAAETAGGVNRPAPEATQRASRPERTEQTGADRICVRLRVGVSRIARPVCKTQREWNDEGGVPEPDR